MDIQLYFRDTRTAFRGGEWLEGGANWNLTTPPKSLEFRLLWFTRGKGNRDLQVVETLPVATGAAMGDAPFRFHLPDAPHSFSGALISLVWAVEAVLLPGELAARAEFVLAPTAQEIVLPSLPQPALPLPQGMAGTLLSRMATRAVQRDESQR